MFKNYRVVCRYSSPITQKSRSRVVMLACDERYANGIADRLNGSADPWTRYVVVPVAA